MAVQDAGTISAVHMGPPVSAWDDLFPALAKSLRPGRREVERSIEIFSFPASARRPRGSDPAFQRQEARLFRRQRNGSRALFFRGPERGARTSTSGHVASRAYPRARRGSGAQGRGEDCGTRLHLPGPVGFEREARHALGRGSTAQSRPSLKRTELDRDGKGHEGEADQDGEGLERCRPTKPFRVAHHGEAQADHEEGIGRV